MNTFLSILLSVVLSAQMDSTQLWIGDQTTLHLEAVAPENEQIIFPRFANKIQEGIEIVEQGSIDTILSKNGPTTYRQDLIITSFKDSLFYLEPLPFVVNGDTQFSNSLSLNVIQPFEMDTTQAITDIKPVMRPKIWWWGIIRWILLGLLLAAVGVGIYFLVRWLKRRQSAETEEPVDPELLRPCDEVALEKLDQIKQEKAWQSGEHKRYFSELTFVVREYIGRRFEVHSTEKTSDDTLAAMKPILIQNGQKELYGKLETMLRLADLVKFAKWSPTPDENEISLSSAYTFVRETAPSQELPNADVQEADFENINKINQEYKQA